MSRSGAQWAGMAFVVGLFVGFLATLFYLIAR